MRIDLEQNDGYTTARFEGAIGDDAKAQFDEMLHPIIADAGGRLLIDLSASPRITSTGLGQLVMLVLRANTKGSRVVFTSPSPFIDSIFSATKLCDFVEIAESVDTGAARLLAD